MGYGLYVLSPVSGVVVTVAGPQNRRSRIDATVAAPGPHDFAVRYRRFRRVPKHLTPQASIATRATFRDDREAPLMAARAKAEDSSDLRNCQ